MNASNISRAIVMTAKGASFVIVGVGFELVNPVACLVGMGLWVVSSLFLVIQKH
jgi:hypothetical protein